MPSVVVEEVTRGKGLVRFADAPTSLHGHDPRFAPPVVAWERYRQSRRNPYVAEAEVARFVARSGGLPVGRIAAHLPEEDAPVGRFGFWAVADDRAVAEALVAAATGWLRDQGATSMTGPWSYEADDEPGLLVQGFGTPGSTGRPWHPPASTDHLLACLPGAQVLEETRTWRLETVDGPEGPAGGATPGQAGRYADARLVLEAVAAVPDVAAELRGSGLKGAWGLAAKARDAKWDGCTVVRCAADPAEVVPHLLTAAARAGYRWVVAPWSPDPDAPPATVHRRYAVEL